MMTWRESVIIPRAPVVPKGGYVVVERDVPFEEVYVAAADCDDAAADINAALAAGRDHTAAGDYYAYARHVITHTFLDQRPSFLESELHCTW